MIIHTETLTPIEPNDRNFLNIQYGSCWLHSCHKHHLSSDKYFGITLPFYATIRITPTLASVNLRRFNTAMIVQFLCLGMFMHY
jgi:hypothetical protein